MAEHASARFGGEAILPLHYFRFLRARGVDVRMIVHERTRDELSQLLGKDDLSRVYFVRDTVMHIWLWKLGKLMPHRVGSIMTGVPMHLITQAMQLRKIRELAKVHGFDLFHEPIPVSPKQPSLLYNVGAPVVIGPMNGGMSFPPAFRGMESSAVRLVVGLGRMFSRFANLIVPGKRRAALLLVANKRTRAALPGGVRSPVLLMPENGVDLALWGQPEAKDTDQSEMSSVQFVFMGRMIKLKAIDLLLKAFARLLEHHGAADSRLLLLGDGDERKNLEALASALGIQDHVQFLGFLPQNDCARILQESDALVMPSLCDCGGAVVLEAMALAKPVIATAWGGPADYLDPTCGILVEPVSSEALIQGFAEAMNTLAQSPSIRRQLGTSGLKKIRQEYDWEKKIDRIIGIYESVVDRCV